MHTVRTVDRYFKVAIEWCGFDLDPSHDKNYAVGLENLVPPAPVALSP